VKARWWGGLWCDPVLMCAFQRLRACVLWLDRHGSERCPAAAVEQKQRTPCTGGGIGGSRWSRHSATHAHGRG
jgi:hypothetical protein